MAYRNKVYVSMDADNDLHYYRLMRAWKQKAIKGTLFKKSS
jgi:hypothetical protein